MTTETSTHFKCKTHDAGPWQIDEKGSGGLRILDFHKIRGCEIEYLTIQHDQEMTKPEENPFQKVVDFITTTIIKTEQNEDLLADLVRLISKTVRGDDNYIKRLLFNGFSCFAKHKIHLISMDRTSQGKTYAALEVAQYWPKENLEILASATPQVFKYMKGDVINEKGESIKAELDKLEEEIENAKALRKPLANLKQKRRAIMQNARILVDLNNKWIIFKEPPRQELLQALYSTLSEDEEESTHKFVNKDSRNRTDLFTVVLRGTPSMLICTARDETKNERWSETQSRFDIVSPGMSVEKMKGGIEVIGYGMGLPKALTQKLVISDKERAQIKELILKIIKLIRKTESQVFNPFIDKLNELFPREDGIRFRQYKRLNSYANLHCLCYSHQRPLVKIDGKWYPSVTKKDLEFANEMIQNTQSLPPSKIRWFNEVFIPCYNDLGRKMRVKDLETFGKSHNRTELVRSIRQNYLDPLFEEGLVEKEKDEENKHYDVYWTSYSGTDISIKPPITLDSFSTFNGSCVKLFVNKIFGSNFEVVHLRNLINLDQYTAAVTGELGN